MPIARRALPFALAGLLATASMPALAQSASFPSRTVTLVVPFTPSSGSDTIARIVGPKLSTLWGQPVIVDNRPGASGNIGTGYAAKAQPDGHTILMAISTITTAPSIYKKLPFDPVADFAPVMKLAEVPFCLAVTPSSPAKDVASLVALAKRNPGKMTYGSPGKGTPQHLAAELMKDRFDIDMLHVAYKGIAPALTDLMGGQVEVMMPSVASVRPLADAGKLRLLAVAGTSRNPQIPTVPTFREQGFDFLDGIDAWYGVLVPAKTPADVIDRITRDFTTVMQMEDVRAELTKAGMTVKLANGAQFGSLIKSDIVRWQKIVAKAGITED